MIYSILDPTGNITALVESPVPATEQPACADRIMAMHPEVEQVGFVRLDGVTDPEPAAMAPAGSEAPVSAYLRMAGGEFCGNASMCAAALYRIRRGEGAADALTDADGNSTVLLRVSGADAPVEVHVRPAQDPEDRSGTEGRNWPDGSNAFRTDIRMPEAAGIEEVYLQFEEQNGVLPLVRMQGISHIVIEETSPFFALRDHAAMAEEAVVQWCTELGADGLGLLFLQQAETEYHLVPLVYVPGSGTVFWENSCASGSSAAGMYLARQAGRPVRVRFREPGGDLTVESSGIGGETRLFGQVRMMGMYNREL